jgi:hypothetical protein
MFRTREQSLRAWNRSTMVWSERGGILDKAAASGTVKFIRAA